MTAETDAAGMTDAELAQELKLCVAFSVSDRAKAAMSEAARRLGMSDAFVERTMAEIEERLQDENFTLRTPRTDAEWLLRQLKAARRLAQQGEGEREGWTGKKCPKCAGSGWDDSPSGALRRCSACAGTGDEYGPLPRPAAERKNAALVEYAAHKHPCPYAGYMLGKQGGCTCGLAALLDSEKEG